MFRPETEQLLQLFELTHDLQVGQGWVMWRRAALPCAGSVYEQPARVMEALAYVCRARNALLAQRHRRRTRDERDG